MESRSVLQLYLLGRGLTASGFAGVLCCCHESCMNQDEKRSRPSAPSAADLEFAARTKDSQLAVLRSDAIKAKARTEELEHRLATSETLGSDLRRELEVVKRKNREQRAELRTVGASPNKSPIKVSSIAAPPTTPPHHHIPTLKRFSPPDFFFARTDETGPDRCVE